MQALAHCFQLEIYNVVTHINYVVPVNEWGGGGVYRTNGIVVLYTCFIHPAK